MRRPKFDDLYKGDWQYDLSDGVGLAFSGVPTDYKIFLDILLQASCNPISSRRILNVLERNEIKYVTVMAFLNFNEIFHQLKEIGVKMEIVPPFKYEKTNSIEINTYIDRVVFDSIMNTENIHELDEESIKIYEERLIETKESLLNKPYFPTDHLIQYDH